MNTSGNAKASATLTKPPKPMKLAKDVEVVVEFDEEAEEAARTPSREKPTVRYSELIFCKVGEFAKLIPLDHANPLPCHDVTNFELNVTSKVIKYNSNTGLIETENTIYIPA